MANIGRLPSLADLQVYKVSKYSKILKKQHRELKTAIGLYAHGVGIGAMVYLRRIFEQLVQEVHDLAIKVNGWDDEEYKRKRFNDKIIMLAQTLPGELPEFLVNNSIAYAVMSKGIHQLEEEECREDFPIVLSAIELILNQRLAAEEQKRAIQEAERLLQERHALRKSED